MLRSSSSMAHEAKEFNARIGRSHFPAAGSIRRELWFQDIRSSDCGASFLFFPLSSLVGGGGTLAPTHHALGQNGWNLQPVILLCPCQEHGTVGKMLDLVPVGECGPECNVRSVW